MRKRRDLTKLRQLSGYASTEHDTRSIDAKQTKHMIADRQRQIFECRYTFWIGLRQTGDFECQERCPPL